MNTKVATLIIIGIVIIGACGAILLLSGQEEPTIEEAIDTNIRSLIEEGDIPSLAAAIIVNDTMIWSQGYGDQSDLDTVFMIGSVTKMFTATAVMQLVENDTLDLDTDINTYLPFSVRHPNYPSTPITLQMLLSHRSGISRNIANKTLWDFDVETITWANENLDAGIDIWDSRPTVATFLNESLDPSGRYYSPDNWGPQPDSDWEYSGTGYLLLAYIVEQVSNQSFAEYLQAHVFTPLDMPSTGYDYATFTGRNAIPYERRDEVNFAYPIYNHYDVGGGALRSTVTDLSHFLIAQMNQGQYRNTQILQSNTVNLMQTSQYSMFGHELGGFTYMGHGLGWPLFEDHIIGHGGATPGYLAQIAFQTVGHTKYGIVFLLNRGSSLVHDEYLLDTFFPAMVTLLFDEAAQRPAS
jgi:CubicO group peptidase (beta-lactamase class C family)